MDFNDVDIKILERIAQAIEEQNRIKEKELDLLININETLKYLR